jgi:hypothetical protein
MLSRLPLLLVSRWQDGTEIGGDVANDSGQERDSIFLNHALPKPL